VKCPKCGYLGFEAVDRCRNCGYDFSLSESSPFPDLSIRKQDDADDRTDALDDLALIDGGAVAGATRRAAAEPQPRRTLEEEFPLFEDSLDADRPLITKASAPRPPLAVRRATPETARIREPRAALLDLDARDPDDEALLDEPMTPAARARTTEWADPRAAAVAAPAALLASRALAALIDVAILAVIDVIVVYFTMQICGVTIDEFDLLPKAPLFAFIAIQNGGYLVAFTAGGQTLGKMLTGIRVVASEPETPLEVGRAVVRTVLWVIMAAPVGLGFVTTLFNRERRGLHDRVAGTRVVRVLAA
jgi:uncharacterized RDD family membrane protein YckC